MHAQINSWFVENRHPETGEYPDFPEDDDGGSKLILNPPPPVEVVQPPEEAGKDKGGAKGQGKGGAKGKKEKGEETESFIHIVVFYEQTGAASNVLQDVAS